MARGAVIVILSDGWERGEPELVGREMARLSRLAHRIVWVNPRVAAAGFVPRAGGMVAALPYIDALVSGHSLAALTEVADAIGGRDQRRRGARRRGGDMGERDAGPGQLGGDAVREDGVKTLHLPGLRPARRCRRTRPGGPQPAFCDREDHNALTAHQKRKELENG